jgi:hypothetical protein
MLAQLTGREMSVNINRANSPISKDGELVEPFSNSLRFGGINLGNLRLKISPLSIPESRATGHEPQVKNS